MAYEGARKKEKEPVVNGINTGQMFATIELVKKKPEMARFQFRASNSWMGGTYNQASVKDFYGAMDEDDTREAAMFEIDEPPVLLGSNLGINPVEYLLVALSGCLTTTLIAHAAARGIEIRNVESRLDGELDVRGFLGVTEEVPVGYEKIAVRMKIDADLSEDEKRELCEMAKKYSPVYNTISKPVPVTVEPDGAEAPIRG
jgi:uncharacterized OsmC-like protein